MRANYVKARKEKKTQRNTTNRLCGDWDETINHIISECSELAQKQYKGRHEWVVKLIFWELYQKYKFDHTTNGTCTTRNPSRWVGPKSYLWIWDRNRTFYLGQTTRRRDIQQKKNWLIIDLALQENHRVKLKESEKIDKHSDLPWEKKWNTTVTEIPIVIHAHGTIPKGLGEDQPFWPIC